MAGYWIKGTRVSLDSVVYRWLEGLSPESTTECFPAPTLEQVYGAIAYYLSHRDEINACLKASEQGYEAFRERVRSRYPGPSEYRLGIRLAYSPTHLTGTLASNASLTPSRYSGLGGVDHIQASERSRVRSFQRGRVMRALEALPRELG